MRVVLLALVLAATAGVALSALSARAPRSAPPARAGAAPARAAVEAAVRRGVAHLVASQQRSGSWGSPASNLWDIYAPVPGAFYTFEVAVTGLAVSALLEAGDEVEGAPATAERGLSWLLANHRKARRNSPDVLYNVWAHAYALEAFARALDHETDDTRRAVLRKACDECIDYLGRFEFVDGGWGYYNFDIVAQRPEHGATSFTTASVLLALHRAAQHGVAVPRKLVDRGLALVDMTRKPDWNFAYSWDHRYYPQGGINKTGGSLARAPACIGAMARWGRAVPTSAPVGALERLEQHGHLLLIARKYPYPHESWFQNSGYFTFYGYYYATELFDLVPPDARRRAAASIVADLLPLQEPDGSWWDYQLYSYHKPYGTAFVLLSLLRCRDLRP
ncbi:MAG: hypothetical protein IT460_02535 [Planctomycetes bacterium]|nr:hypothetical protein [Planctomycetota bacterium]